MNKINDFLKEYNISKSDKIVVATSGGPDSMYLLNSLNELGYKCICAHVNHNVRSVSDNEYIFVENYCKTRNIAFEGMKIKKYHHDNFHNDARTIRYNFFKEVVQKYNAKYLATAHHGDDLIETILMRLTRGSNLNGYKGFSSYEKLKDYTIIRPLIKYTKEEIKTKCDKINLKYVLDLSNTSSKYTRNRYRLNILNFLKKENPNVHLKYYEFSQDIKEVYEYIEEICAIKKSTMYKNKKLDLNQFKQEKKVIQKTIIEQILKELYLNDINKVSKLNVKDIINLIYNKKPQLTIELPNNIYVKKIYNEMVFTKKKNFCVDYEYILQDKLILPNKSTLEILKKDIDDTTNYTIRLNSKEINLPLIVRNRKSGDKMIVKNMHNYKKVKEIFIENKINLEARKDWPIVLDNNNEIIWVPGLKKSKFDIKKSDKYDIIIKYSLKERENEQ